MKRFALLLIGISLLTFAACNRDKDDDDEDVTAAEDQALAQAMFDDVGNQSEGSAETAESEEDEWGNCATITVDTMGSPFPLKITVDFGDVNCIGQDGRSRRGKLNYTITDWYRNEGSTITVIPEDYYVNDNKVEGTRTSTNKGENSNGQLHFEVKVENGVVTTTNGETITWESTRTRTWVEGQSTGFFTSNGSGGWLGWAGIIDDVYEITGSGSGTGRKGVDYTVNITSPLRVQLDCRWITEGVITLSPDGFEDRVIDYGDGECDNKADVSIGSWEKEITLRG